MASHEAEESLRVFEIVVLYKCLEKHQVFLCLLHEGCSSGSIPPPPTSHPFLLPPPLLLMSHFLLVILFSSCTVYWIFGSSGAIQGGVARNLHSLRIPASRKGLGQDCWHTYTRNLMMSLLVMWPWCHCHVKAQYRITIHLLCCFIQNLNYESGFVEWVSVGYVLTTSQLSMFTNCMLHMSDHY